MLSSGHYQAVIHLHTIWSYGKGAADRFLGSYFKSHRYIGSKDKRRIGDLFFALFRHQRFLDAMIGEENPPPYQRLIAFLLLKEVLTKDHLVTLWHEGKYGPPALTETDFLLIQKLESTPLPADAAIRESVPPLFEKGLQKTLGNSFDRNIAILNGEASFDLRVNITRLSRQAVLHTFEKEGIEGVLTPHSPWGIRLKERFPIKGHSLYEQGFIDVQDEGAQALVNECPLPSSSDPLLLDYCAGAGGKTLAFAEKWHRRGTFILTDYDTHRLQKAKERLKRQGVKGRYVPFEKKALEPYLGKADLVFVDTPCTGTGTWRRNPELKWAFDPQTFEALLQTQAHLLKEAALYVKEGGFLVYATCSLLPEENEEQVAHFLKEQGDIFSLEGDQGTSLGTYYTPFKKGTDGYYKSIFKRKISSSSNLIDQV